MTNTKNRACTGKTQYGSKLDALGTAQWRMRQFGVTRDQTNVYRCDFCGYWHIGHRPRHAGHR